jgi:hypothetical protein
VTHGEGLEKGGEFRCREVRGKRTLFQTVYRSGSYAFGGISTHRPSWGGVVLHFEVCRRLTGDLPLGLVCVGGCLGDEGAGNGLGRPFRAFFGGMGTWAVGAG